MKDFLAISILLRISSSHLEFSKINSPRCTNLLTCSTSYQSDSIFTLVISFLLLITIVFVLLIFIFIPKCLPSLFTLLAYSCNLFSFSAVVAVSSTCLKSLILLPSTETPSSSFSITLKLNLVKRLKRYGDSTHPCLVSLLIWIP